MITIGIDPGKRGAVAIFDSNSHRFVDFGPFPFIGDELNILEMANRMESYRHHPRQAVIEKVHAMPGQGVCSMFTFGRGYGELMGMLKTLGIPIINPTPQQWKKEVLAGMNWKGDKSASIEYVMRRYPEVNLTPGKLRNPHDGIADAVCLAEYGQKGTCFL